MITVNVPPTFNIEDSYSFDFVSSEDDLSSLIFSNKKNNDIYLYTLKTNNVKAKTIMSNSEKAKAIMSNSESPRTEIITHPLINRIYSMQAPLEDYPTIEEKARDSSCLIFESIYSKFSLIPERIEPSIEGGMALVYHNSPKFFNKKELFIEVYNDGSFLMMLHKKYKNIIKLEEVQLANQETIYKYIEMLSQ